MTTSTGGYRLEFAGISDTGCRRKKNEDWWHCGFLWDDRCVLAVVADGVGGYAGGEVAARMATEEMVSYLRHNKDGERKQLLKQALIHANNAVYRRRLREDRLFRMCCVLTAVLFDQDMGCISMAHVGDTRFYAFSDGRIIKLSHDQSPVGRDEDAGIISETEAMQNPYRNIIERAVGQQMLDNGIDYIETNVFPMGQGITWMLCSDGLSDMITSARISSVLSGSGTPEDKVRRLTDAANEAGGNDNITVVLVSACGNPDGHTSDVMDAYADKVILSKCRSMYAEADGTDTDMEPMVGEPSADPGLSEPEPMTEPDNTPLTVDNRPADIPPVRDMQSNPFPWLPFLLSVLAGLLVVLLTYFHVPSSWQSGADDNPQSDSITERRRYERLYYNINNLPLQHNTRE